ncbi:RNA-binding protein 26-like [Megalops cyprinoides]|uniref:RNA-binding protein 26-like n=1 Tax=Megalops cyprinoides TaxID=118141 RepID=UPI001863E972|nr:RNA-binding protein 26-like [Megalops cyprinoides]
MIIENVEALKSWLAKLLEPICEADPAALANYVVALVKKEKPEKDLKVLCADQLDVFLQKETAGFVDKLFDCLSTKTYLANLEPPTKEVPKEETKLSVKKLAEKEEGGSINADRDGRRKRSPLKNRSDFNESRSRDDRDRRREDHKRRDADRHGKSGTSYRERHHERRRGGGGRTAGHGHRRSHSRSRSRSRSGSRGKSRDRDRSRGRDHRSRFEQERKEADGYAPASVAKCSPPHQQQPHPPLPLLPLPPAQHPRPSGAPPIPSSVTTAGPAHLPAGSAQIRPDYFANHTEGTGIRRQRCRDYDEKGFCVRGDLCPFDHGRDPLVVDDVTLPAMIPFPPPPGVPPPRVAVPPLADPSPSVMAPAPPHRPAPPLSTLPTSGNHDPEVYNPEAPGITASDQHQYIPRVQTQRPNLIGLTSRDTEALSSRAANIIIQTEPTVPTVPCKGPRFSSEQESRKRPLGAIEGPAAKKPWMENQNYNNQQKPGFQKKNHYTNTKLEVRKIPRDLNNITQLNEHFSKFGTIVNIQVAFGGDPEAALIQYTANEEARRAISSTEAVLNNRFIRVHWHRDNSEQQSHQPHGQSQSAPSGLQHTGTHKVINAQHGPGAYALSKTVATHAPGIGAGSNPVTRHVGSDPSLTTTTSASLQKGASSSLVMKPASKPVGKSARVLEACEAMKKKQEALKLQQDMRKKKQEMLENQIDCQKVLINRLERNKSMKPDERASIMKTLKQLTEKISQLKDEMRQASSSQPKNKEDAQKELLDAELDFHKKLSSGEDTTDLKKRLNQLQVEATRLGLIPTGRGKVTPVRGRGQSRGRGRGLRGRGRGGHLVVDHRPRALAILGVTSAEKDELRPHFVQFGEIEDLRDHDATSVVLTFKTRGEAENAANQGAKFKGRTLQISWYKPKTPSVSVEPEEEESKDEEAISSRFLHEEDEEDDDEDDESESRSWRR